MAKKHICGACPPGVAGLPADELLHRRPPAWQCVLWAPHQGCPHEDYRGMKFDVDDPCWKERRRGSLRVVPTITSIGAMAGGGPRRTP